MLSRVFKILKFLKLSKFFNLFFFFFRIFSLKTKIFKNRIICQTAIADEYLCVQNLKSISSKMAE